MRRPGYAGKILRIDLTRQRLSSEPTAKYADRFVGGRGINAWILFNELGPLRPAPSTLRTC
jgi:aldehyde:ferredoxin oxidoreductase